MKRTALAWAVAAALGGLLLLQLPAARAFGEPDVWFWLGTLLVASLAVLSTTVASPVAWKTPVPGVEKETTLEGAEDRVPRIVRTRNQ